MKILKSTLILLGTAHFLLAANGSIMGIIGDEKTKMPLSGAEISIQKTNFITTSDLKGKYIITNITPGIYTLQAKSIGYKTMILKNIQVEKNATTKVDFWMVPAGIEKETITLKAKGKEENTVNKSFQNKTEKLFSDDQKNKDVNKPTINSEANNNDKTESMTSPAISRANKTKDEESETKVEEKTPDDTYYWSRSYDKNENKETEERISGEALFDNLPLPEKKDEEVPNAIISEPVQNKFPGFSGLKAGFSDDNEQFNYFLNFLKEFGQDIDFYPIEISERIQLKILDKNNKSIPNADVTINAKNKTCKTGKTYGDGSFFIYPLQLKIEDSDFGAEVRYKNIIKKIIIKRNGPRTIYIHLDTDRDSLKQIPVDLLFVLDVTGSMGEELERLKTSIEIINLNIASLNIKPDVRFGMVSYRDQDDDFVTKLIPFTGDLQAFQNELSNLSAKGGGDDSEDLQSALKDAMQKMDWNEQGIRLGFIITDAPTHLDYEQKYTYVNAAEDARSKAVKFFTVGTGGLEIAGEYILRQISQYTYGKYIFLTYGEEGESEGGKPGSVSHHTGSNFQTDKLEAVIIRFAKEELSYLSDIEILVDERFIQASKVDFEEKEETVEKLFTAAIDELWDYSSIALPDPVNLSVIPLSVDRESLENTAEYFTERLNFALSRMAGINLIERKNLQFIANELKIQLSGIVEVSDAAKIGQWIGADYQIIGNLYFKDGNFEAYLKLVRVSTAEILSVTKLVIDYRLGL